MFSKGVDLLDADSSGLLEGIGKKARYIKLSQPDDVNRTEVQSLIEEAAHRTRCA